MRVTLPFNVAQFRACLVTLRILVQKFKHDVIVVERHGTIMTKANVLKTFLVTDKYINKIMLTFQVVISNIYWTEKIHHIFNVLNLAAHNGEIFENFCKIH